MSTPPAALFEESKGRASAADTVAQRLDEGAKIGLAAAALAVLVGLAFVLGAPRTFPLDDAYIHLAYGKSLAFSGTLGLNPGEPSLGTSSPLWALVLVPLFWAFRDPYWSIHFVGLASTAGAVFIAARLLWTSLGSLSLSRNERRIFTGLGAFVVGTNGSLVWMSLSGMETSLVLFLCLAAILSYVRTGPSWRTGLLLGLCLVGRTTSLALFAAIGLVELAASRRIWQSLRMFAVAVAMYTPYAAYSYRISGSVFPNTAKGKLITYVSGGFDPDAFPHYWGRVLAFHRYLPAYGILLGALVAAFVLRRRTRTDSALLALARRPERTAMAVLLVWAALHLAQYTLAFRTIGQQGRYLAEYLTAIAVVGTFGVASIAAVLTSPRARLALAATVVLAQLSTLPYWRSVYRNNLAHVWTAYVQMANYIRNETPADARVASFDIGTVRYVGDRYSLDLGGLVDTSTHDCLRERNCGEYTRTHHADYIMYPKDPEADFLTGVQQAQFAPRWAMREEFMQEFRAADYSAPTMTHSFRLQLFRIAGWYDRTKPGEVLKVFAPTNVPMTATSVNPDGDFEVVGYHVDVRDMVYIREYPYTFTIWLRYRATAPLDRPKWLHVLIWDDKAHRMIGGVHELVTQGLVTPGEWPVGQVLEEHRLLGLPYDLLHPDYHLYVTVTSNREVDDRYPELYQWVDLGMIHVERSKTTALAPI